MDIAFQLMQLALGLVSFVFVLRFYFEASRVDPRFPLSQNLIRLTQPILTPLSKILPTIGRVNLAALVVIVLISAIYPYFVALQFGLPSGVLFALLTGVLSVVKGVGQVLFFALFIRAIMSWVSQGGHPADMLVLQLTEPVIAPVRRVLPTLGMFDFSIMLVGFVLLALNSWLGSLFGVAWVLA